MDEVIVQVVEVGRHPYELLLIQPIQHPLFPHLVDDPLAVAHVEDYCHEELKHPKLTRKGQPCLRELQREEDSNKRRREIQVYEILYNCILSNVHDMCANQALLIYFLHYLF